jgi:hypothetical protein
LSIRDLYFREYLLAYLSPHLPAPMRTDALVRALEWTNNSQYIFHDKAESLAYLSQYLTEILKKEAIDQAVVAARNIESDYFRILAHAKLGSYLSAQSLHQVLKDARALEEDSDRVIAMAALVPHLDEPLKSETLNEVVKGVEVLDEILYKAEALANIASLISEELKSKTLRLIQNETYVDESDRAYTVAVAAALLPISDLPQALKDSFNIIDEDMRIYAISALAPHVAKLPRQVLYPLWKETLSVLSEQTRRELISTLRALVPVITALGGAEDIEEAYRAIEDVGRWWP